MSIRKRNTNLVSTHCSHPGKVHCHCLGLYRPNISWVIAYPYYVSAKHLLCSMTCTRAYVRVHVSATSQMMRRMSKMKSSVETFKPYMLLVMLVTFQLADAADDEQCKTMTKRPSLIDLIPVM